VYIVSGLEERVNLLMPTVVFSLFLSIVSSKVDLMFPKPEIKFIKWVYVNNNNNNKQINKNMTDTMTSMLF